MYSCAFLCISRTPLSLLLVTVCFMTRRILPNTMPTSVNVKWHECKKCFIHSSHIITHTISIWLRSWCWLQLWTNSGMLYDVFPSVYIALHWMYSLSRCGAVKCKSIKFTNLCGQMPKMLFEVSLMLDNVPLTPANHNHHHQSWVQQIEAKCARAIKSRRSEEFLQHLSKASCLRILSVFLASYGI